MKHSPLYLDQQLCFALYAATHAVTRAYRVRLAELNLTYPQYLTLMALWETDGLTVRGLALRLKIDSATLTPLLKRLETAGFVTRKRSRDDERLVQVFLTDRGHEVRAPVASVQAAVARATGLDAPSSERLRAKLVALADAVTAADARAAAGA